MNNNKNKNWEFFKFVAMVSGMMAYGLGGLAIVSGNPISILGFLVHPILIFLIWRKADLFLKDGIQK